MVQNVSFSKFLPNMIAMPLYKVGCEIFFLFRIIGNLYYKEAVLVHLYWSVIRVRSRTTIV